jgi:hypothetical protein
MDPATEENVGRVLDPQRSIDTVRSEYPEFAYLIPLSDSRVAEVDAATRSAVATQRERDGRTSGGYEFYCRLAKPEVAAAVPTPGLVR